MNPIFEMIMPRFFAILIVVFLCWCHISCGKRANSTSEIDTTSQVQNATLDTASLRTEANFSYSIGLYIDAIEPYTKLIEIDSTVGEFYFKRGYGYAQLNMHDEAVPDFIKAAQLGYRNYDSHLNAAVCLTLLDQDSLAKVFLKRCIEISPDSTAPADLLDIINKRNDRIVNGKSI